MKSATFLILPIDLILPVSKLSPTSDLRTYARMRSTLRELPVSQERLFNEVWDFKTSLFNSMHGH